MRLAALALALACVTPAYAGGQSGSTHGLTAIVDERDGAGIFTYIYSFEWDQIRVCGGSPEIRDYEGGGPGEIRLQDYTNPQNDLTIYYDSRYFFVRYTITNQDTLVAYTNFDVIHKGDMESYYTGADCKNVWSYTPVPPPGD